MNARTAPGTFLMTPRDHLEIETEGERSPLQAEISRLSLDAEARKLRLTQALRAYENRRAAIIIELERIAAAEAETRAELAELQA